MLNQNEVIVFLIALGVIWFLCIFKEHLNELRQPKLLLSAFAMLVLAWLATNLEHLFAYTFFNTVEHLSYALNGVLLALWCYGERARD